MTIPITPLVPLTSETRWSDLLAVLIATDPACATALLGLPPEPERVRVRREASGGKEYRIDLLVDVDGHLRTVVEVKVLSGLGRNQLARYDKAWPDADRRVLVFPERLPIDGVAQAGWQPLPWEDLLAAFSASRNTWVAQTAAAWHAHLRASTPNLHGTTRWNELLLDEGFVVALRARMAWVRQRMSPPPGVDYDLVSSAAGVSWVARMFTPAARPGYSLLAEAEENLPVRNYPKYAGHGPAIRGPSVKVCLRQDDVTTSAGFDWGYLLALWPTMHAARNDWVTNTARPKASHDRAGWESLVQAGGPRFLGVGYGEAQAKISGECMFGARFQLPPNVTLDQTVQALDQDRRTGPGSLRNSLSR